jgi:hypothetical protein
MCFSAPVSIVTAAGTGLAGAYSAVRVAHWREIPLASMPIVFCAQQTIEAVLWLALPEAQNSAWTNALASAFAFFALVVWPLLCPMAAGLVEQHRERRIAIGALLALALFVSYVGLNNIAAQRYGVCIVEHSLVYSNGLPYAPPLLAAYAISTCCPLLLSSEKVLQAFGGVVVTGLVTSVYFFIASSFSVWCFFAAAGSVTVALRMSMPRTQIAGL